MMQTKRTHFPRLRQPEQQIALFIGAIVSALEAKQERVKDGLRMVQQSLPGIPPVTSGHSLLPEYQIVPVKSIKNGFQLICADDPATTLAEVVIPNDLSPEQTEARFLLVYAMVETFNSVQQEIQEGR